MSCRRDLAPVAVVAAPSRDLNRWINARRQHHRNVIPVDPAPGNWSTSMPVVGEAILAGLGKSTLVSTPTTAPLVLASAWLSLGEHTDAVVVDAQLLTPLVLAGTIEVLTAHKVRPWLTVATTGERTRAFDACVALVEDHAGTVVDERELRAAFPDAAARVEPVPLARVPLVEGLAFRSTCRAVLDPADAAEFDTAFVAKVDGYRKKLRGVAGEDARGLIPVVYEMLVGAPDTDALVLWAAALQVAAITEGIDVAVNRPVLVGAAEALPRPASADRRRLWERLDVYCDPQIGAAAALYTHGAGTADIGTLTVGDLATTHRDEARVVAWDITITGDAARYLRALAVLHELTGSSPDDALFGRTHGSLRASGIRDYLIAPASEIGAAFATPIPARGRRTAAGWLAAHGITVTKLGHPSLPSRP